MTPWPDTMPGKCWVDHCDRHERLGEDGLSFALSHWTELDQAADLAPAGDCDLDLAPDPEADRSQGRTVSLLGWQEVQQRAEVPAGWARLPLRNEVTAGLEAPLWLRFTGLAGPSYRLALEDQSIFSPFDSTLGAGSYDAVGDDGELVDQDFAQAFLDLAPRGRYALYLRPRTWRITARVLAHFLIVTPFETAWNDEFFPRTYYDRPPVYPYRHDVIHTSLTADLQSWDGDPRSYDQAIDWAFANSRIAGDLTREIQQQQYFSYCYSYIYVGHEVAELDVWREPPPVGQIAFGLGAQDAGGQEGRLWYIQRQDLSDRYPRTLLGQYVAPTYSCPTVQW